MAKKASESSKKTTRKKDTSDFFNELMKKAGVEIPPASQVDEVAITKFYSTGSLALNALLSGAATLGGIAGNKVTALAGEESTGKTFIALQVVKYFLDNEPQGHVFIFDSEDDPSKSEQSLEDRGIDTNRVHVKRVKTIQEFRTALIKLIDQYLAVPVEKRLPMFLVLDSLGNLSTLKELHDTEKGAVNKKGEDIRDMTRAPLIRGLFRVLTIKLGEAGIPLLMTNHTYATMDPYGSAGYGMARDMSGGGGLKYAASTIVVLTKKTLRDEDDKSVVLGSVLTATLAKSRFTRYGKKVDLLLTHDMGLDKYWGLFELGKDNEVLVAGTGVDPKKGNGIPVNSYKFPDGQIATRKEIIANPAQYFDAPENVAAFEELAATQFRFGHGEQRPPEDNLENATDAEFEEPQPDNPETEDGPADGEVPVEEEAASSVTPSAPKKTKRKK